MMRKAGLGACLASAIAVAAIHPLTPARLDAGEYHTSQQNICSDCHVSHASKSGQTWIPTEKLLKSSEGQVPLCTSCHDGREAVSVKPGTPGRGSLAVGGRQ